MVSGAVDTSVDAMAILEANEAYNGKILGTLNPAPRVGGATTGTQIVTGQFISPSIYANPQATVNSSVSSTPVPVINSGAGEDADALFPEAAAGALTGATAGTATGVTGTTGATSAISTSSPVANARSAGATPLLTTTGVSQVDVATRAGSTTSAAGINPLTAGALAGGLTTGNARTVATIGTASAPIRIQMTSTGAVTVSNISTTPATTTRPARVRAVSRTP
jgi:hypothetical protein